MAGRPLAPKKIVPEEEILSIDEIRDEIWRLLSLLPELGNIEATIEWLARRRLIRNTVSCPTCNELCSLVSCTQLTDKKRWSCRRCNVKPSI